MSNKNGSGINIYCRFIAAIIFIAGPVVGCGDSPDASKLGSPEAIVVRVNDAKVTVENFLHMLRLEEKKFRLEGKDSLNEEALLWLKNQVLSQLVQRELFMQEALQHKIDILDEEYKPKWKKTICIDLTNDVFEKTMSDRIHSPLLCNVRSRVHEDDK